MNAKKLADSINMNQIQWAREVSARSFPFAVTYAASTKSLSFNRKTIQMLDIGKWEQVVVGYLPKEKVIALKLVEPDEYGAVALRPSMTYSKENKKSKAKETGGKTVCISHVIASFPFVPKKRYRPERAGNVILLAESNGEDE